MVLVLDGNSGHAAHAWRKNVFFVEKEFDFRPLSLYSNACTWSNSRYIRTYIWVTISDISTMLYILLLLIPYWCNTCKKNEQDIKIETRMRKRVFDKIIDIETIF